MTLVVGCLACYASYGGFVAHTSLSHVDRKRSIGRENVFLLFGLNTKCIVLLNALTLIEAICPKIHLQRMKKSSFGRTSVFALTP